MKLSVKERLQLLKILPRQGTFITLKVINDLNHQIGFSDQEIDTIKLSTAQGKIEWKQEVEKEIEFASTGKKIIADAIKELDEKKLLTMDMLSLYEKFVGE